MQLYYYAVNQPEIPDMSMSFSNPSVVAYKDGDGQRTENVTFYADSSQSIVMNLPAGVVFHNVTTGATSAPGASVTVPGGTTFYLSAPMSQTGDSGGSWSSTMHGNISEDYGNTDMFQATFGKRPPTRKELRWRKAPNIRSSKWRKPGSLWKRGWQS